MSHFTPPEKTVLFPEPLRRSRTGLWSALFAVAVVAGVAAGWRMSGGEDDGDLPESFAAMPSAVTPPSRPLAAQISPVDAGVRAYKAAAYDSATIVLRRAIHGRGPDSLAQPQRLRALTYLGAAEVMRGKRDSADAAFRQLLRESPRSEPDDLEFPPAVLDRFTRVRSALHGVARIRTTSRGVELIVVAFTPHRAGVGVRAGDGKPVLTLFDGMVKDSVLVSWDGTADGAPVPLGSYDLVLIAFGPDGAMRSAVRFPVLMRQGDDGKPRLKSVDQPASAPTSPLADASGGHGGQLMP